MLLFVLTGFAFNAYAASVPVLMLLEHTEADKKIQTKIEIKDGLVVSPNKGKPQLRWTLRAGDATKSKTQPNDRVVGFYKITGNDNTLLFIVKVRYFPNSDGRWTPQFQLNEEPLVARDGARWKPLTTIQGVPGLIVQTGTALPNAEGYSSSLELGFTTGAASLDAWRVQ